VEVIAGVKDTRTVHREHGCIFEVDLSQVMWSQGNKAEKERLACLVKPKETIVDMFAGIGYFSIMAAKRAKRLFAIDINPDSIELLRRNVMLNRLDGRVEILEATAASLPRYWKAWQTGFSWAIYSILRSSCPMQ
jgi:tRNA wybutosine-synthesizing protein 2